MGLLGILTGLGCGGAEDDLTAEELAAIVKLSPLPPLKSDPTNAYADDPAAAALGKKLFFETRYSGPIKVSADLSTGALGKEGETGKVGCVSCHNPEAAFIDRRSNPNNVSTGTKDEKLVPLNLTRQEMADLVAFLEALSGEPLPADLTEPPALP
jgi:cytochrome c peroxidase